MIDDDVDIKNQWARDDPAFSVILLSLMCLSNLVHTLVFGERTLKNIIVVLVESICFDFALVSVIVSFVYWYVLITQFEQNDNLNR